MVTNKTKLDEAILSIIYYILNVCMECCHGVTVPLRGGFGGSLVECEGSVAYCLHLLGPIYAW